MGNIFVLMVDDIVCGLFTSGVDSDIAFDKLLKEIPPNHFVRTLECVKNKRVVGTIRKGIEIRKEEGVLCI